MDPAHSLDAPMTTSAPFLVLIMKLAMSSPDSVNSVEWQDITGECYAPWSPKASAEWLGLPASQFEAAKVFVAKYATIEDDSERARFAHPSEFEGRTEEEDVGRFALAWWFTGVWWRIDTVMEEELERHGFNMDDLVREDMSTDVVCIPSWTASTDSPVDV